MSHPNGYRRPVPPPPNVDLSHVPQEIRDAVNAPVPWRPGEATGILSSKPGFRAGTQTALRVYASIEKTTVDGSTKEMVEIRVNDTQGRNALVQLQMVPDDFEAFLGRLVELYKARGGRLRPLLNAYEGKGIGSK